MNPYVAIAILFVVSAGLAAAIIILGETFGPERPTQRKLAPYESGMIPIGRAMQRMPIRFYLIATLFIIFDVEVIFLFAWALVYRELAVYGLLAMGIFLALLIIGLIYEWRKGALEWE